MTEQPVYEWMHWRYWRNVLVNGFFVVALIIAALILVRVIWGDYFDRPPVQVESRNPVNLGVLCPGETVPFQNYVTIDAPVVVIYYVSVMDRAGVTNIVGHQEIYSGFQHPIPGTFE